MKKGSSNKEDNYNPTDESSSTSTLSEEKFDELSQIPIRRRQRFTSEETKVLEDIYKKHERPSAELKQVLASQFHTTVARIQIWFQNRRAKAKKKPRPTSSNSPPLLPPTDINQEEEEEEEKETGNLASKYHKTNNERKLQRSPKKSNKKNVVGPVPLMTSNLRQPQLTGNTSYSSNLDSASHPHLMYSSNCKNIYSMPYPAKLCPSDWPYPPVNIPAAYYPSYFPHFQELNAPNSNDLTSFIDPQKMTYSREGESSSMNAQHHNSNGENLSPDRDYQGTEKDRKKKGKMPDKR